MSGNNSLRSSGPLGSSGRLLCLSAALVCGAALPLSAQTAGMAAMPMCHSAPGSETALPPEQLPPPERMSGIGTMHFPITTSKPEAQQWFEQGVNLNYDFWDYEAERAFEQAVRVDPDCAMCYWGLSQAESSHGKGTRAWSHAALQKAIALKGRVPVRERLYIEVAAAEEAANSAAGDEGKPDMAPTIKLLRTLVKQNPRDTNARILLSGVVGDGYDDAGEPRPGQKEARSLLQSVLKDEPNNSGANHLWIHAVEASAHPADALHSAEILASLSPTSGHMVHMPGHIFYRTGDYARAQQAFYASTEADEAYMRAQHVSVDDDWNYVHNLMYSIANLLEEGHMREAVEVSAKLTGARGQRADSLYPWSARDAISRLNPDLPVALRTADWKRAAAMLDAAKVPASLPNLSFLAESLTHFVVGMQQVEAHDAHAAAQHSELLDAALWRFSEQGKREDEAKKKPDEKAETSLTNEAISPDPMAKPLLKTLSIMSLELRAAVLVAQKRIPEAEALFADARREEKDLGYHEPPFYIRPVGESEAAALMSVSEWSRAKTAYEQALSERPNAGLPLYGIAAADKQSGDAAQATTAYQKFLTAWKTADPDMPQVTHARAYVAQHDTTFATR